MRSTGPRCDKLWALAHLDYHKWLEPMPSSAIQPKRWLFKGQRVVVGIAPAEGAVGTDHELDCRLSYGANYSLDHEKKSAEPGTLKLWAMSRSRGEK